MEYKGVQIGVSNYGLFFAHDYNLYDIETYKQICGMIDAHKKKEKTYVPFPIISIDRECTKIYEGKAGAPLIEKRCSYHWVSWADGGPGFLSKKRERINDESIYLDTPENRTVLASMIETQKKIDALEEYQSEALDKLVTVRWQVLNPAAAPEQQ